MKPDPFNLPAFVVKAEDHRTDRRFTKALLEARYRQDQRDLQHEARLDNLFFGKPYKSLLDELNELKPGEKTDGERTWATGQNS